MINYLAENALPIWAIGAMAFTMALVVFLQTRTNRALAGMAAVVAIVGLLLLAERLVETPREAVERSLYQLAATVEANDVQGALSFVAPGAAPEIRHDIEKLMPLVKIDRARIIGTPKIEVDDSPNPTKATVECRGLVIAMVKQSGMKGGAEDELTMTWTRRGDRWLVDGYTSKRNWNRAVGR